MTRKEAIEAMKQGHKVTQEYFSPDEYLYMKDGSIYSEENYNFGGIYGEFMTKYGGSQPDGWSIYE